MKEHINNLQESYELSTQHINDAVNPLEVAALFEKENITYVLIGGHILSYYTGSARATVDVDFIISNECFSHATKTINDTYSQFKQHDHVFHVTYDSQQSKRIDPERIDLVKDGFLLFREVVKKYSVSIRDTKHTIKIPTIEAAIALKFAASISPNRGDESKSVDNADLLRLVRSKSKLNNKTLSALGNMIYPNGGKELVAIVSDIQNGKPVNL